jgi:multidrug efflux pump subunit AcrB
VRADQATGGMIRVRDLGRVELAANTYSLRSLLNNKEAAAIAVFQAPGSNALALSNDVRKTMERLKPDRHCPVAGGRVTRPHRNRDPGDERYRPQGAGHR